MNEIKEKALSIAKTSGTTKRQWMLLLLMFSPKASFTDYFILCSGGSDRQVAALVENIEDMMEPKGIFPNNVEGRRTSGWILMDYGDIVVNVMTQEMRERYNLEKVWGDCETISVE